MATGTSADLPPPDSWEDLETIIADVARRELADPLVVEHGRRGQDDDGVDVYAQPDGEYYVGFQCKDTESLSKGEMEEEMEKAEDFEPGLDDFVIVWSGRRDKNLQEDVRELSEENDGGFRVGLWFWDDVSDILQRHPDLLQIHASEEQTDYRKLKSAGCYRLSETHFDRAESRELPEVWRRGIRPKDVRDGYVVDRRWDESDEEDDEPEWVNVTEELTAGLEKEDVMVRAPPGCGKSAICHSVAVEWYERGKGAVFVRRSGKSEFPETDVLEGFIRAADGHVLVIVEDAVRDETRDVYELMYDLLDLDGVSFLLDGRDGEYEDFDPAPRKDTTEATEFRKILQEETNHVGVPLLDPGECERLRDLFDEETESDTDLSGEHLLRRALSRGRAGEMLHLAYHLLGGSDGDTGLEEDVRDKFDSLNEASESNVQRTELRNYDRDLRRTVGVLVNLLNVAGVPLRREFVRALPSVMDGDYSTGTMDDLLYNGLGGWMVFGDRDHPRVTPQHEFWSVLFLRYLVEGPRDEESSGKDSGPPVTRKVAMESVAHCVNAVVAVLDDEELRSDVWSADDGTHLREEIEESPEEKANDYLGRIFKVSREWPVLSSLFGSVNDDIYTIRDAEVCPDWVVARMMAFRGDGYHDRGELEEATTEYERGLEAIGDAESEDEKRVEPLLLFGKGKALFSNGKLHEAEEVFDQCIEIQREIDDQEGESASLDYLGKIAYGCGAWDRAEEYFEESLAIKREIGNRAGEATTLNNLGGVHEARGEWVAAEEYYEYSLTIMREIGNREGEAATLNNLGDVAHRRGQMDAAEDYHEDSLAIEREIGHRGGEAKSLGNLGKVFVAQDELDAAAKNFHEALAIQRDIGDRQAEAVSLSNLGFVLSKKRDHETAHEHLNDAVEMLFDIGDVREGLSALSHLVDVCEALGKSNEVREHCERALETIENADLPGLDDDERRFREQYAKIPTDDAEEGALDLYTFALQRVQSEDPVRATELFEAVWNRRDDVDENSDVYPLIPAGGVGLASLVQRLSEVTDYQSEVDVDSVLREIEPDRDRLPLPAKAVFEYLHDGETETTPESLHQLAQWTAPNDGGQETDDPPIGTLNAKVFATLLNTLQADD